MSAKNPNALVNPATLDKLVERARDFYQVAIDYLGTPDILFQLGLIAALFVPAWFLSGIVEKRIEGAARRIRGMPGLLRVIVAFLRRLEWLFFALFLAIAYVATRIAGWPASNYLIYSAMLLSAAWLFISAVSHIIRKRTLAKAFAFVHSRLLPGSMSLRCCSALRTTSRQSSTATAPRFPSSTRPCGRF
jgi:hypothetical protein